MTPILIFLSSFAFLLSGASPSIAPRDSADMASAALTLGVAHPPGYPLYSVLGHAWLTLLPWGNPAYRLAVMSAAAGAGAVFFLFIYVRPRGLWPALLSSSVFLFSAPLWKFSLLQEKYSLHALFAAALLFLSEGEDSSFDRRLRLSCFLFGLGLVNHQSLLLWSPAFVLLWSRRVPAVRVLSSGLPWLAAGLTPYAFLWIRLGSLREAMSVALRAQYGSGTLAPGLSGGLTPEGAVSLLGWSLAAWASAVSVPAALAAAGGAFLSKDRARTAALLLGAVCAGPLFVLLARFDVSSWVARTALEPAFIIPALAAAVLAGDAVAAAPPLAAPALALALSAASLALRSPIPERRDDFLAHDYARSLRRAVPPGGAVLAGGDTALFALRWLELTEPRPPAREVAGAGLTDRASWLSARAGRPDSFLTGLPAEGAAAWPEGLVLRLGAKPGAAAPVILRRSASWERDESYARDAKLAYAFAAWNAARTLEARGKTAPEALDLTAVSLDPEDYRLE